MGLNGEVTSLSCAIACNPSGGVDRPAGRHPRRLLSDRQNLDNPATDSSDEG